jgi:hypothetical protein
MWPHDHAGLQRWRPKALGQGVHGRGARVLRATAQLRDARPAVSHCNGGDTLWRRPKENGKPHWRDEVAGSTPAWDEGRVWWERWEAWGQWQLRLRQWSSEDLRWWSSSGWAGDGGSCSTERQQRCDWQGTACADQRKMRGQLHLGGALALATTPSSGGCNAGADSALKDAVAVELGFDMGLGGGSGSAGIKEHGNDNE